MISLFIILTSLGIMGLGFLMIAAMANTPIPDDATVTGGLLLIVAGVCVAIGGLIVHLFM